MAIYRVISILISTWKTFKVPNMFDFFSRHVELTSAPPVCSAPLQPRMRQVGILIAILSELSLASLPSGNDGHRLTTPVFTCISDELLLLIRADICPLHAHTRARKRCCSCTVCRARREVKRLSDIRSPPAPPSCIVIRHQQTTCQLFQRTSTSQTTLA